MGWWGGADSQKYPSPRREMRHRVQRYLLAEFYFAVVSFPLVVCVMPLFRSVAAVTRGAKTRAPTRGRASKTLRARQQIRETHAHRRLDVPHVFDLRPIDPQTRAARDDFTGKYTAG